MKATRKKKKIRLSINDIIEYKKDNLIKKNRTMPNVNLIVEHWNTKYNLFFDKYYCWGCGFPCNFLHRAHLLARSSGGSNNCDNLILLCRDCHLGIQENFTYSEREAERIKYLILDGMPFFSIQKNRILTNAKLGLYDHLIESIGVSKNDFELFKKIPI
jgi:5-methylcytosine-specific restriction endonuclease McrA